MPGVCIVTGASRGVGAAIACRVARQGYRVAVNYVSGRATAEAVCNAVTGAGGEAMAIRGDVGNPDDVRAMFEDIEKAFGRPTALVNNAAIAGPRTPITEAVPQELARVVSVNLLGPLYCISEASRRMSKLNGGAGGVIINISSMAVRTGGHLLTPYVAAKGGLEAATLALARELGPHGIRVNALRLGVIATDAHPVDQPEWRTKMEATIPLRRLGETKDVASAVAWLLSNDADYITAATLDITGGR